VWRLGRRMCLSCADPEDPYEGWGQGRLVREDATLSQALVFLTPALTLHNGSSVMRFPHAGRRQPMENRLA
jgi:hypothetical protein